MGFSSCLQGASSHEALLARQDAEIRLLETMRRCLALRVKAERDYAAGLNAFLLQAGANGAANGAEPGANLAAGPLGATSQVARAWGVFVEEAERAAKMVKENADFLAAQTMEKLAALYQEKKANRKHYQDESSRISLELHRLQECVAKTRADYERCLENHAHCKAKLEDHSLKGRTGKRLEDVRERYQKACKKLHLTHNDYVLLLCEASEFERDMRTILLPGLLEHQQAIQEDMVDKWKLLLQEIQRHTNPADKRHQELQQRVEQSVATIRSSDEYSRFIEQHKTSPPPGVAFKFDPGLNTMLQTTGIVLDDLTLDSLKVRLAENEARLAECRSQIKDKQTLIIQYDTELATVKFKSDPSSVQRMFSVKKVTDVLKKEVNELRCLEQKLTRQNELIQVPLNELGCEQAPNGCGDLLPDGSGSDPHLAASASGSRGSKKSLSLSTVGSGSGSGGQVINLLRKPFSGNSRRAGSVSSSTGSGLPHKPEVRNNNSREDVDNVSGGSGHGFAEETQLEINADGMLDGGGDKVGDGEIFNSSHDLASPTSANSSAASSSSAPPPAPPAATSSSSLPTMQFEPGRPLDEELWFHGVLPRGEVVRLLATDGDFLVRQTTRNDEKQVVLSVMWSSPKHFIVQTSPEGLFRFEGPAFDTVQELIIHQFSSGGAVTSRSGAILKAPVLREPWELNNDDVDLLEKIGRGNFGDVYRANLKSANIPVAVKTCKVTLPDEQKKKFLQEGRILKQYDHPNIVRFIGICVQKQPIMIVMELVPGGSLLNFLRNHSGAALTQKGLLGMCLDASAGMQYLESKNCIHRDLAARNCLVGEANVVKISDFGMSREEEEYTVSDGLKQIPIKWTAPEALNYGKYTSLCDVWSYGVLAWEIFSRGGTPYQGMTNTRAREMLDSGYRMPAPEGIPEEMYQLMLRCWNYDPEDRPHFPEIHAAVDLLYSRLFFRRSVTFETSPLRQGSSPSHRSRMDSPNWFVSTIRRHFRKI